MSQHSIDDLSRTVGAELPAAYREFLGSERGAVKGTWVCLPDGDTTIVQELYGASGVVEWLKVFSQRIPKDAIPIRCDPLGNLFLLRMPSGEVLFWDHELGETAGVAPDFPAFLGALFDAPTDPDTLPWEAAIRNEDMPQLERVIATNLASSFRNSCEQNMAEVAAIHGAETALRRLLEVGVPRGKSLLFACQNGHAECASMLLVGGEQHTPEMLILACSFGHADTVKLLLSHGADPDATDSRGNSAREEARLMDRKEILSLFA